MIALALAAGALAGALLLLFSHVAPFFGAGNFIRDVDEPRFFGTTVTRREAHLIGATLHVLVSAAFGGAFALLIEAGVFPSFAFLPILGWSVILTIFVGGVVMPLEGHGVFGVKEDAWFPVDLFLTNVLWSVLFYWMMQLWPTIVF